MELMAAVLTGMILGYLLGCLVADLKKAARIASAAQLDDYIDWAKVPEGYDWMAVDGGGGSEYWDAGVPIAYGAPIHILEDGENMCWCTEGTKLSPQYVAKSAIIGPLPPWRESLRRRPGSEKAGA